jgi:hypothetical protein
MGCVTLRRLWVVEPCVARAKVSIARATAVDGLVRRGLGCARFSAAVRSVGSVGRGEGRPRSARAVGWQAKRRGCPARPGLCPTRQWTGLAKQRVALLRGGQASVSGGEATLCGARHGHGKAIPVVGRRRLRGTSGADHRPARVPQSIGLRRLWRAKPPNGQARRSGTQGRSKAPPCPAPAPASPGVAKPRLRNATECNAKGKQREACRRNG